MAKHALVLLTGLTLCLPRCGTGAAPYGHQHKAFAVRHGAAPYGINGNTNRPSGAGRARPRTCRRQENRGRASDPR